MFSFFYKTSLNYQFISIQIFFIKLLSVILLDISYILTLNNNNYLLSHEKNIIKKIEIIIFVFFFSLFNFDFSNKIHLCLNVVSNI